MSEWVGYGVSLYLGEPLGWYQGIITEAKRDSITLKKAFRNGFPYSTPTVTIKASDIKELKIVFPPEKDKKENTCNTSKTLPKENQRHYRKEPKQYYSTKPRPKFNEINT